MGRFREALRRMRIYAVSVGRAPVVCAAGCVLLAAAGRGLFTAGGTMAAGLAAADNKVFDFIRNYLINFVCFVNKRKYTIKSEI